MKPNAGVNMLECPNRTLFVFIVAPGFDTACGETRTQPVVLQFGNAEFGHQFVVVIAYVRGSV